MPARDTFVYSAIGFGRDVISNANLTNDTFDLSSIATSLGDLHFGTAHIGASDYATITGSQWNQTDKILVKEFTGADLRTNGHFMF